MRFTQRIYIGVIGDSLDVQAPRKAMHKATMLTVN